MRLWYLQEEQNGKILKLCMLQKWAARKIRPVSEKKRPKEPLLTGIRVHDSLFPCALGSTCALPGAWGCGKAMTVLQLAMYANCDVFVSVRCGERGPELTSDMMDLHATSFQKNGKQEAVMKKGVLIANMTNMSVACREASIYVGATIAEYFRDMGKNCLLIADSTSRWAEALRETSNRLGEIPGDKGFPTYLDHRIASFYDRAGLIECSGLPTRQGSLTIIGTLSPPGGDFSDPVVRSTLRVTQNFWALDIKLAQRRHFPSVNWFLSHSQSLKDLSEFYQDFEPDFLGVMTKIKIILEKEGQLVEKISLIGKADLQDSEKIVLEFARMIREDFLAQNLFSTFERYCPLQKTFEMARTMVNAFELTSQIVESTGNKVTWSAIKERCDEEFYKIMTLKFQEFQLESERDSFRNDCQKLNTKLQTKLFELKIDTQFS